MREPLATLEDVYVYEDKFDVIRGFNAPVFFILTVLIFIGLTLVGICGAIIYGACHG